MTELCVFVLREKADYRLMSFVPCSGKPWGVTGVGHVLRAISERFAAVEVEHIGKGVVKGAAGVEVVDLSPDPGVGR